MVFSSTTFLLAFLPLVGILYFICPKKLRNALLLVFSLLFYGWGEPKYILIMLFSTVFDYCNGLAIGHFRTAGKPKGAKAVLVVSVVGNLSILGFFKYTDFAITNLNGLLGTAVPALGLLLPIGISFYTFQTMSYTIDVYRGAAKAQKNIINFGAYVTLFPQLIAGPIVRYQTVADELEHRDCTADLFADGVKRFACGIGKKVLLANNIGLLWEAAYAQAAPTVLTAWLGVIAYGFQIYFDFSGYSDMAIGLGRMLGFRFLENFNYPFLADSITDFWRRWHISMGTWFRDYVYIPLGGNRVSLPRQILNLFIVWGLTGLWHGASWNFVIWGLYYFVFLCLEKFVLKKFFDKIPKVIRWMYSMFVVLIGWMIFYFEDFSAMKSAFSVAFGASGNSLTDPVMNAMIINNIPFIIIAAIACAPVAKLVKAGIAKLKQRAPVTAPIFGTVFNVAMLILCVASLAGSTYNPFLYFRF